MTIGPGDTGHIAEHNRIIAILAAPAVYRQPTDPAPTVHFGTAYTWFKTDPTTGVVIDWLEGTGTL